MALSGWQYLVVVSSAAAAGPAAAIGIVVAAAAAAVTGIAAAAAAKAAGVRPRLAPPSPRSTSTAMPLCQPTVTGSLRSLKLRLKA